MSIKKTQLEITIEQNQTWRISQSDFEDSFDSRQTNKPALLKNLYSMEISPRENRIQGLILKILVLFVRVINYSLRFLGRLKAME